MAAPKGNNFAAGNKGGGREPDYKEPAQLQAKIDEYFRIEKIPTIPGLAFHLGFAHRQSLLDYEGKEEFSFPIKRAKLFIEAFNAKALHRKEGGVTGIIFTLKNLGWKDQQDLDVNMNMENLSDSALIAIGNYLFNKSLKNGK